MLCHTVLVGEKDGKSSEPLPVGRWVEGIVLSIVGTAIWSYLAFVKKHLRWIPVGKHWSALGGLIVWLLVIDLVVPLAIGLVTLVRGATRRRGMVYAGLMARNAVFKSVFVLLGLEVLAFAFEAVTSVITGKAVFGYWFL